MNTALAQIQEEISRIEERLKLLRTAETALLELEPKPKWPEAASYIRPERPAKGIAAAIRELIIRMGPMSKADLDSHLSGSYKLGKGTISGALQAMKVRGVVSRTKAGKWAVK